MTRKRNQYSTEMVRDLMAPLKSTPDPDKWLDWWANMSPTERRRCFFYVYALAADRL